MKKQLTIEKNFCIISKLFGRYGGVAQLARALGSYPGCHWFKSNRRYHLRGAKSGAPLFRPGGQAAKTPPFHGGNTSSILVRVTIKGQHR